MVAVDEQQQSRLREACGGDPVQVELVQRLLAGVDRRAGGYKHRMSELGLALLVVVATVLLLAVTGHAHL